MKFNYNATQEYRQKLGEGYTEVISKFAFFPIIINGKGRWFEFVK